MSICIRVVATHFVFFCFQSMAAEMNLYENQIVQYKGELDILNREMRDLKKRYFAQKKRKMATSEFDPVNVNTENQSNSIKPQNIKDERGKFTGGGFRLTQPLSWTNYENCYFCSLISVQKVGRVSKPELFVVRYQTKQIRLRHPDFPRLFFLIGGETQSNKKWSPFPRVFFLRFDLWTDLYALMSSEYVDKIQTEYFVSSSTVSGTSKTGTVLCCHEKISLNSYGKERWINL